MAYTKLGDITWSASSPEITGAIYSDYQRSGADMKYKIKVVLNPLSYGSSSYGFNIFASITLDGVSKVSGHAIKGNTSYASGGYTYETDWLTVSKKASGTTALTVNIYTTSDPDQINNNYKYSLYVVPSASTMTVPAITLGTAAKLVITPAATGYKHTIKYKFGGASGTIVSGTSDTEINWTPSLSLAQQIPSAVSGSGTLTLETYSGTTQIGSRDYTFKATVPDSVKPAVSALALSDDAGYLATYNGYVQGKSRLKAKITATQAQGSAIKTYTLVVGGVTYNPSGGEITVDLPAAGTINIVARVTDNRGRTSANYSTTITVLPYGPPQVTAMSAVRCTSDGTADATGTCVKVVFSGSVAALNNINTATWKIQHRKASVQSWTDTSLSVSSKFAPNKVSKIITEIAENSAYIFRIVATDAITGDVPSVAVPVPAGYAFFRTNAELNGLSFGKEQVKANTLGVAWNAEFDGDLTCCGKNLRYADTLYGIDSIPEGADLDTYLTPRRYRIASTSTANSLINRPVPDASFEGGILIVERLGTLASSYLRQTYEVWGSNCTTYVRYKNSSGWKAWKKLVIATEDGEIATPSGIRVPEMQGGTVTVPSTAAGATKVLTVKFPKPFSGAPHVVCSVSTSAPENIEVSAGYDATTDQCTVAVHNGNASSAWTGAIKWIGIY